MSNKAQETKCQKTTSVGYKQPPEHTQFKPGRSGNPRGRPKRRAFDLDRNFADAFAKTVTAKTANGRQIEVAKGAAGAHQLVKAALAGDNKATALLLDLLWRYRAAGAFKEPLMFYDDPEGRGL